MTVPSASGTALSRLAHAITPLDTDSTSPSWPVGLGSPVIAAAAAADAAALVAEVAALVALPAAAVAELAALVAEVEASPALVVAVVADEAALVAEVAASATLLAINAASEAAAAAESTAASEAALIPGITPELSSTVSVLIWFIDVRTVASSVACTFRTGHGSTGVNVGIDIVDSPRLNKALYVYRYLLFSRATVHATPILDPPVHCQGVVAIVAIVSNPDTRLGPKGRKYPCNIIAHVWS